MKFTHPNATLALLARQGEVDSPLLGNFGLSRGLATGRKAAWLPSFLACDRRVDELGPGFYYWNPQLRVQPCEYQQEHQQCDQLW